MNRSEHLLTILSEEGGEVSKECCKALRFGLDDKLTMDPAGPRGTEGLTNAEKIHQEFVDMLAVYLMAQYEGLVPALEIEIPYGPLFEAVKAKQARVESYLVYSKVVGALTA